MRRLLWLVPLTLVAVVVWPLGTDDNSHFEWEADLADEAPSVSEDSPGLALRDASLEPQGAVPSAREKDWRPRIEETSIPAAQASAPQSRVSTLLDELQDEERSLGSRLAALEEIEWRTGFANQRPRPHVLREPGMTLRKWRALRSYERAGLDLADVRALLLQALMSSVASVRTKALVRLNEHRFTARELNPVIGGAVRKDERSYWFTAEQIVERVRLGPQEVDDLLVDWEMAFRDGSAERQRFLVGLTARLRPRPSRVADFVLSALSSPHRSVRAAAVNAIARLITDGHDVGHALARAASDPDDRVAQLATEWIASLNR